MIYVARISNEFEAASWEDDILTAPLLLLCRFFFLMFVLDISPLFMHFFFCRFLLDIMTFK